MKTVTQTVASSLENSNSDDGDTTGKGDSSSVASTSSGIPTKKRKAIEKSKEDSVPLPDPFPKHCVEVEMAIKEHKFSNVARQAFIGKVASAMLFYKHYPTSEDYANVGRSVIQKYPCLKSPVGTPVGKLTLINLRSEHACLTLVILPCPYPFVVYKVLCKVHETQAILYNLNKKLNSVIKIHFGEFPTALPFR